MNKNCIIITALCFTTNATAMYAIRPTYLHTLAGMGIITEMINVINLPKVPKVNINAQDNNGDTALHWAIDNNNHNVISVLLKNGANPDIKNKNGVTPLMNAIIKRSKDCALLLIENGAEHTPLSMRNKKYYNPEDYIGNFMSTSPKGQEILCHYYPAYELFNHKGGSPKNEPITEDYTFMAPIHAALLSAKLMSWYKQEQTNLAVFANFILQHYLANEVSHNFTLRHYYLMKNTKQLVITKLLEV